MAGASLMKALVANFTIGVIKLIVGTLTASAAMFAEALHSFADTFNQILLALGIRYSKKAPDIEHPFGYQKNQFFWSFVVAVLIFGISGSIAFIEGLEIIRHPDHHEIKKDLFIWNIVVLVVAMVLEYYALKAAYAEAKAYQKELKTESLIEALDEMQDPVLLSLLVEDTLALGGLVVALIGVSLTFITEDPIIDGFTSLFIGVMLMVGGLLLARENKTYLIGKSVTQRTRQTIRDVLAKHVPIIEINSMKTLLMGHQDLILAVDLTFDDAVKDVAGEIDKIEKELIKAVPYLKANKIFIEVQ